MRALANGLRQHTLEPVIHDSPLASVHCGRRQRDRLRPAAVQNSSPELSRASCSQFASGSLLFGPPSAPPSLPSGQLGRLTCVQRCLQRAASNTQDDAPSPHPAQQFGHLRRGLLLRHVGLLGTNGRAGQLCMHAQACFSVHYLPIHAHFGHTCCVAVGADSPMDKSRASAAMDGVGQQVDVILTYDNGTKMQDASCHWRCLASAAPDIRAAEKWRLELTTEMVL